MPGAKPGSKVVRQARVLEALESGRSVKEACEFGGVKFFTYAGWRQDDRGFAERADAAKGRFAARARALGVVEAGSRPVLGFVEWRRHFLGMETYAHQLQWVDVLEGRDPGFLSGCEWDPRERNRLIVNTPPFHAKTQLITVDWVNYLICMNPDVQVAIVSKRAEMAEKMLYQIRQRLTSEMFGPLQKAYAPAEGWRPKAGEGAFKSNLLYVAGRTMDRKDPTVEALGMGGQIYGGRFDVIILDDCVNLSNAAEFEKQARWIESEVDSRTKDGTIILVGTRLASADLYSFLRDDDRFPITGRSPWSYLRQPMVLEETGDPASWVTLWPYSSTPLEVGQKQLDNGLFEAWPGVRASKLRDQKPPAVWSLVYQQMATPDDAAFTPLMVSACTDGQRAPGPLTPGALGHPVSLDGSWTIGSMDPAMAGDCFTLVCRAFRSSRERWVENAWVEHSPSPQYIRDLIRKVTDEYHVNEWVIERQGFQAFLTRDPEINQFLASRGVRMTEHYTGSVKNDPDYGVASLSGLFGTFRRINDGAGRVVPNYDGLIHLPQPRTPGVKALVDQLLTWVPGVQGKRLKQDGPMALWFAEMRARVFVGDGESSGPTHMALPFLTRRQQAKIPNRLRGLRVG